MTQEEILEYNKRCAEFLGYKKDNVNGRDVVRIPDKTWSEWSNRFQEYVEDNWYALYEPSFHSLQFHSDWNWIMEVIEAIKNLKETKGQGIGTLMVTKFEMNNNSVTIAFENGDYYDCIHVGHTDNGKYFKHQGDSNTLKEAVVSAINQFLIWYEQNKTT